MSKSIILDLQPLRKKYLEEGYSINDLAIEFNCSRFPIRNFLKENGIVKDEKQRAEERNKKYKENSLKKYGCENPMQNEKMREKMKWIWNNRTEEEKQKIIDKFKESWNNKPEEEKKEIKEKTKKTCLEKYDCENPSQNVEIREKMKWIWNNRTEEEKQKIIDKFKESWNNKPEEEKQEITNKWKKSWNNKTEEEKQKIKDKLKESWNNKTEEEKLKIRDKIKEKNKQTWNNKTEEKQKISNKMKEKMKRAWNNRTEEEKQKISDKMKEKMKQVWNNKTGEEKQEIKEKMKQAWNNKTKEERQKKIEKFKQTMNNKSEKEKQERKDKIKECWNNKTEEEKQEIRDKMRENWNNKTKEEKLRAIEKQKQTLLKHFEQGLIKPSFTSKPEIEIKEFLEELGLEEGIDFKKNKSVLKGEELDIYLPNYNIAIEFNGYRFHSSTKQEYQLSKLFPTKPQNYHFQKYQLCKELNIRLISIWDIDWTYNPIQRDKIKSVLRAVLLPNSLNKIYARKTTIKEIDYQAYKAFCDGYHLQNSRMAKIRYGLFYNNELIQVMSFGKVYNNGKENKEIEYELIRNCIKDSYIVVGGTERLFKHFIKQYNPQSILTYSDNDFFTGDSYSRLGFNFIGETGPSLFWVDRENKIKLYRNPFKNKEYCELEKQRKLLRCYGCGSKKFIWKNKEYLQK